MPRPVFKDGKPLFIVPPGFGGFPGTGPARVAFGADENCDCCPFTCPECEPFTASFTFAWANACQKGATLTLTDTTPTGGCPYLYTIWELPPGASLVSASPNNTTIVISVAPQFCGAITMGHYVTCAHGCVCGAGVTQIINRNGCLCCQNCAGDDLSPAFATMTVNGLSDNLDWFPNPGVCVAANGTYILPKVPGVGGPGHEFLACQYEGFFSVGIPGPCKALFIHGTVFVSCDGIMATGGSVQTQGGCGCAGAGAGTTGCVGCNGSLSAVYHPNVNVRPGPCCLGDVTFTWSV